MRKFYKTALPQEIDGGFCISLDGKEVKTPAGASFILPTQKLAQAIANEWQEQGEKIDLKAMPLTTLSYGAIDQVNENRALIESEVSAYAGSDLICYRADSPKELTQKEAELWDPIVTWLDDEFGVRLKLTSGIAHVEQDSNTINFAQNYINQLHPFSLAAIQRMTGVLGSLLLAIAVEKHRLSANEAWLASRVDENYQAEQWGEDEEAKVEAQAKHNQFTACATFLALLED